MKKVKYYIVSVLAVVMAVLFLATPAVQTKAVEYGQTTTTRVRIRASASTDSDIVVVIDKPSRVQINEELTAADGKVWYKVLYDNQTGYIRSDLVQKGWTLYINKDGVRIRGGAGTTYNIVATVSSGIKFNVSAQQDDADGKTWYYGSLTYDGQTVSGFVRSDMLSETKPATTPASTTIPGTQKVSPSPSVEPSIEVTMEPSPEPSMEPEPSVAPSVAPSPVPEKKEEVPKYVIMEPVGSPYVPEGFEEKMVSTGSEQYVKAWQYGKFFLLYASEDGSQPEWYMYDSATRTYQKYVYADKPAGKQEVNKPSTGKTVAIVILIAVCIVLAIVVGFLWLRLKEYMYLLAEDDEKDEKEEKASKKPAEAEPVLRRPEPVHASVRTGTPRDILEEGTVSREPVHKAPREEPASIRRKGELAPTITFPEETKAEESAPSVDPEVLKEELRAAEAVRAYEETKAIREGRYREEPPKITEPPKIETDTIVDSAAVAAEIRAAEEARAAEMARITENAREVERQYQERRATVSEELTPADFAPIPVKQEDKYVEEAPTTEISFNLDDDDQATTSGDETPKNIPIDTDDDFEILDI